MAETETEEFPKGTRFALEVMGVMLNQSHTTHQQLEDSYKKIADEAKAELNAVRWLIDDLLSGNYMPTPAALRHALWPSKELIEQIKDYS